VTALGVRQLAEAMFTPHKRQGRMVEEVVFFDLGSGVGRMTAQVVCVCVAVLMLAVVKQE
jgi:hypothetical protein